MTLNRLYKVCLLIAFAVLIWIISTTFNGCQSKVIPPQDTLKEHIKTLTKERDLLLIASQQNDIIIYRDVIKYRYLKGRIDTIPCEELLPKIVNVCDSIIVIDSTQICLLKNVIVKDSVIIKDYRSIAVNDSITIKGLHKDLRRQRNRTKLAVIIGAIVTGVLLVK